MWPEVEKAKSENRHELVLRGNEITKRLKNGGLDRNIFDLNLNFLDICETSLESVPDDILKLANLQSLVLHSNNLEVFNTNIAKLEKLKLLDLSRNRLKQVPEEINNLSNVVTLNFTYNSLGEFPKLLNTQKLAVLNLSNNKLNKFPDICYQELSNLAELKLSDNLIEIVPHEIKNLSTLKHLELGNNKIRTLPGELADCTKLKVLELKNNPIGDRRLKKLIDQCRIKQILDYIKAHCPKLIIEPLPDEQKNNTEQSDSDDDFKHSIHVHYAKDNIRVVIDDSVKTIREHFAACLVHIPAFTEETFKKFIQIQNKLHDSVCSKRNLSTIATHDFNKLPPGDLQYTTLPPTELHIHPLNRTTSMTGADLFTKLQTEANNLRKEKKRNTYSGIHKYLYLIEGHPRFPCLLTSESVVISFPPITNSEVSKIHPGTKIMLVEVTSSVSLHLCKVALDALLKELVLLMGDLDVTQIKTVDQQGNLKVVYPSKTDLNFEGGDIKIIRG